MKRNAAAYTRARAVGRPRALTLDEILDTAIGLGLSGLNMPTLAAKLGTATATLYNYVSNRDDLLRLAALKQARLTSLNDIGQDWQALVRMHALGFFQLFASEPQLIVQYMYGAIGPDVLLDYVETFLAAMHRRGFDADQAYRIFSDVNTVVLGAAVRATYLETREDSGVGHAATIRRSLQARDHRELPHVRASREFGDDQRAYSFEEVLDRVIGSFALEFDRR